MKSPITTKKKSNDTMFVPYHTANRQQAQPK